MPFIGLLVVGGMPVDQLARRLVQQLAVDEGGGEGRAGLPEERSSAAVQGGDADVCDDAAR
jgi:hypothetical protein